MSCQNKSTPAFTGQMMVDKRPQFERSVYSRKLKVRRPTKMGPKRKFL